MFVNPWRLNHRAAQWKNAGETKLVSFLLIVKEVYNWQWLKQTQHKR